MLSKTLFSGALLMRLLAPVAAIPNFFGRDESCTATVTVYSTTGGSSPSSNSNSISSAPAVAPGSGPVTVTVLNTVTVISTIYATSNPSPQFTGSRTAGGPRTVTVTVTSVLTSVETKTILATQTITQVVTQTLAQDANVQTAVNGGGNSVTYTTVTSTFTTTNTISVSSRAGVPPQPSSQPFYSNATGLVTYNNGTGTGSSSNASDPSIATPSSRTNPLSLLDPPSSSTTVPLASSPSTSASLTNVSSSNYENGLYFVNWGIYGADFQPQSLPASEITRVFYAFADIQSDGTVVTSDAYADLEKHYPTDSWGDVNSTSNAYGCVKQLYILKKQNRNMKVLLSIGGWTYSSKFSPVAADATMRQTFANSAVALVTDWGFDGVDIDWEFNAYAATAADSQNIILLLQALRAAFDAWSAQYAPSYRFLITVASPAGPSTYAQWNLGSMDPYVDSWNLMAYDYAGSWDTYSGHAANIYPLPANPNATPFNTDQAVTAYIQSGIAPAKIIMGLPLYGRSFEGTTGLGQSYTGVGAGDGLGAGQWRYKNLPRAGATEYFDTVARATYSYDSATAELISYDNVQSTTAKSQYLMSRGLGGAMFWEASDDKNGTDSLVATMAGLLGSLDVAQNLLNYPTSKWDNIRNGMPGS